jgi:hypothetical protein
MPAAVPIVASLAAPFITQLVGGIAQNFLGGASGGGGAAGGIGSSLFGPILGPLLNQFTSAFQPLLGQAGSSPSGLQVPPTPTPFSTAGMAPASYNDPVTQLSPRMEDFRTIAYRSPVSSTYQDDSGAVVRDHRHPEGSGTVIVRDHRHSEGGGVVVLPRPLPPARPPVASSDGERLDQLQAEANQAKQALLADPKNASKALAAQEAEQSLQTTSQLLFQESSIRASIESNSIRSWKVS